MQQGVYVLFGVNGLSMQCWPWVNLLNIFAISMVHTHL